MEMVTLLYSYECMVDVLKNPPLCGAQSVIGKPQSSPPKNLRCSPPSFWCMWRLSSSTKCRHGHPPPMHRHRFSSPGTLSVHFVTTLVFLFFYTMAFMWISMTGSTLMFNKIKPPSNDITNLLKETRNRVTQRKNKRREVGAEHKHSPNMQNPFH